MRPLLIVAAILLLATGCEEEIKKIDFKQEQYGTKKLAACDDDLCPKIDIQLIRAKGDTPLAQSVNKAVTAVVTGNLSMSPDEENEIKTIDEGLEHFINDYRDFKAEFPQSPEEYEIKMTSKISYRDEQLLSITIDAYTYYGGAHGYGSKRYLNFDMQTGEPLDTDALIKDKSAFMNVVEKKFREQRDIPINGNINDTGYMFENDTFSLPDNIGFDWEEMILVYNPYEVAAYADGQIVIKIPIDEVREYLAVEI